MKMSPRLQIPLVLFVSALGSLVPSAASAYVREVTSTGIAVSWRNPCILMQIFLGDIPPVLTADQFLQAATTAASVWSQPTLACSDIRLSVIPNVLPTADVADDNKNVIVFRRQTWCSSSSPTANPNDTTCYADSALAVTTLFKNKKTGQLLDADIAFNAVDYAWGDLVALPDLTAGPTPTVDFQNALTHELGHVIGLDHSCFTASDNEPRLLDNNGQPAIDCYGSALPQSIADSTMFPSVSLNDIERRDLAPDDEQGVCDIYPYTHATCPAPAEDGGCSTLSSRGPKPSSRGRTAPIAAAGFLFALLVLASRRRSKQI